VYKSVSKHIRAIFFEYTDLVEPLSLDEAYLDVTENKKGIPSAIAIAREIKSRIKQELDLTASAGVSFNKFLAKTASGMNKPNGLTYISEKEAPGVLDSLSIEAFHGIGKVTAEKFKNMGTQNGQDLKKWSLENLSAKFGKVGKYYFNIVRSNDQRPVEPFRVTKSISAEQTFEKDLLDLELSRRKLASMCLTVFKRLEKSGKAGKTITLKMRSSDFKTITRSKTLGRSFGSLIELQKISDELLVQNFEKFKPIRLLGIGVSNFLGKNSSTQLKINF